MNACAPWRAAEARQAGKPAFWVFHETVLHAIAAARPHTVQDLARVYGIGQANREAYGPAILEIVRQVEHAAGQTSPRL